MKGMLEGRSFVIEYRVVKTKTRAWFDTKTTTTILV